jgi:uncharacterized protein YlxW (UPF0749 family)
MIESQTEVGQLQARWQALETRIEELKAKATRARAKDMAQFVRQIAALRAQQEAHGTNGKDGRAS